MYHLKSSKAVYESDWMTVYEDSVIDDKKGTEGMVNSITVNDAVIIVPIFEDRSILMVINYRHGVSANLEGLYKKMKIHPILQDANC